MHRGAQSFSEHLALCVHIFSTVENEIKSEDNNLLDLSHTNFTIYNFILKF